jgi:hypothetical protein
MPAAATGESQHLSGTSCSVSRIAASSAGCDEHPSTPLGHSEVLSVQHSPGDAIPDVDQTPDDRRHISAAVRREKSGDVLNQRPSRSDGVDDSEVFPPEPGLGSGESVPVSGEGEVLAGESSDHKVNGSIALRFVGCDVVVDRHTWPVSGEHGLCPWVDFAVADDGVSGVL